MRRKVLDRIQMMQNEIVDFTKELIAVPNIVPPGENYLEVATLIGKKMKQMGLEVQLIEFPRDRLDEIAAYMKRRRMEPKEPLLPRINVLGKWKGTTGKPSLHVNSHFSMLPIDHYTREKGERAPYKAAVEKGKLYGKGASDIKGGIAGMLFAAEAIKSEDLKLKGDLIFSATCDAHLGGPGGAHYIVEQGYGKADMVIQVDVSYGTHVLAVGCNGAIYFKVTTYGKRAHGSASTEGINAVEKMAKVIEVIQALKERKKHVMSAWPIRPASGRNPHITIGTTIKGGQKIQLVPDLCEMTIDRRIIPEETVAEVREEFINTIMKLKEDDPELEVDVEIIDSVPPFVENPETLLAKSMLKNIQEVTRMKPVIAVKGGYKENRFFQQGWKVPTMSYSGGRYEYLKKDEFILVKDLVDATKVMALTYMDILGFD